MATPTLPPADHWTLRTRTLKFGRLPLLMGIVNVTPDSFSDGGRFFDPEDAVEHGLRLAEEGADLLDIGGESTRPGAEAVDVQEELRRVMPVLGALVRQTGVPISIDTSKSLVARHALHAGAEMINDVTAMTGDAAMLPLAVESGCGVCLMHMLGQPRTMQDRPVYGDVVAEVLEYLEARRDALLAAGVPKDRIALDPGIGFGKTTGHNLELLANAGRFHALGCPLVIGHSRKRFLGEVARWPGERSGNAVAAIDMPEPTPPAETPTLIPLPATDRTAGTIGVALSLARQGVQVIRVHDVAAVRQAMVLFQATGGLC